MGTRSANLNTTAFLSSIIESSDDAIFGLTLDGIVVSWNKAAEGMYGYSAAEIVEKSVFILCPPNRTDEIERNLGRLRNGERVPHFETVRMRKDGSLIDVSVTVSLVKDSGGALAGAAVIARDITEQKRMREAASAADRIKQQFLDNMSHEIRTPLNGILGMTELVLDSELTAEQHENLGLVRISAESLLAAIDDILDFSQIDAGRLKLESIAFDFRESLGETLKILGFRAQKRGLELIYEVDPQIPPVLIGDPGRLRRILFNLVGNAIKFTERGEILVTVSGESQNTTATRLHFTIKDTGIGISPEQQQRIFDPFSQGDSSLTRKRGGAGLGLAIVRRLVELMRGSIWLESELGAGSTFHFTVDLGAHAGAYSSSVPPQLDALQGLSALIVDDNSVSRRVLRAMLNRWGMKATDVADGDAALEALRIARDIGHPFPLVLLDKQLQKVDGFLIAEEIKKDSSLAAATIMMLTSVGHVGDAARCRNLGIAAYLVKPIGLNELVNAVALALQRSAGKEEIPLVTRHFLRETKGEFQVR